MPLLFQGVSPLSITFAGKNVKSLFYNGTEVWNALPPKDSLENMSWEDISLVCRAGAASEYWQLGDTKYMVPGNAATILQIIGFDHDIVTDAAAYGRERAGLTLQLLQPPTSLNAALNGTNYAGTSWHHSTAMYRSTVRTTLFPNYYESTIPQELKSVLVPVDKSYITADGGVEGIISDTLFLASNNEILGNDNSGFGSEGAQYAYYAQGNSRVKKNANGSAITWWTRSPTGSNAKFFQIDTSGAQASNWVIASAYAPPCMCV